MTKQLQLYDNFIRQHSDKNEKEGLLLVRSEVMKLKEIPPHRVNGILIGWALQGLGGYFLTSSEERRTKIVVLLKSQL